jgi:hypothetical protein
MTELEEAELTDGQTAPRKRHARRLVNEMATDVQNEQQKTVQNEAPEQSAIGE